MQDKSNASQPELNGESQLLREQRTRPGRPLRNCIPAIRLWLSTNLIVWFGAWLGFYILPQHAHEYQKPGTLCAAMTYWDGNWYMRIVNDGYTYDPSRQSSVAFFPGYPCVVLGVRLLTTLPTDIVMLLVSNSAFLGAVVLFQIYLESDNTKESRSASKLSQLALCIWPTSFYFRIGYSESLFLLIVLLAFVGIRRNWPLWMIALVIGAGTGVRSVGISLLLPLAWILWKHSTSWRQLIQRSILLGPLSCWGLLAFMIHLQVRFGNPFAFVQAQEHWKSIEPLPPLLNLLSVLSLEPAWNVYNPWSPTVWYNDGVPIPLFSMLFWNPIYFLVCTTLIVYGVKKNWLTPTEWLLSAGLLGIPFITQSHRLGMMSHGRFTSVVFPMFIVLGHLLARWPVSRRNTVLSLLTVQAFYWTALFTASFQIW